MFRENYLTKISQNHLKTSSYNIFGFVYNYSADQRPTKKIGIIF